MFCHPYTNPTHGYEELNYGSITLILKAILVASYVFPS